MNQARAVVLPKPETWYKVYGDRVEAIEVVSHSQSNVWCNNTMWPDCRKQLRSQKTTSWYKIVPTFEAARALVKADLERRLKSTHRVIVEANEDIEVLTQRLAAIHKLKAPELPRPLPQLTKKDL